jgi:hypothetical protein
MTVLQPDGDTEREIVVTTDRHTRVVTDEEGRLWRVREVRFADAPPSLIFESDVGFRRVRAYPSNWRALAETELYELSWRT